MPTHQRNLSRTPTPRAAVGQVWASRGTQREVVDFDEFTVTMRTVGGGYRTKCQRVSKWGSPRGYTFVREGRQPCLHPFPCLASPPVLTGEAEPCASCAPAVPAARQALCSAGLSTG